MTPRFIAHRFIPLLTMLVLLLNLLAPVGVALAQDGSPPPEPPPAEELLVEENDPAPEEPVSEEGAPPAEQKEPTPEEPPAEEETTVDESLPNETQDEEAPVVEEQQPQEEPQPEAEESAEPETSDLAEELPETEEQVKPEESPETEEAEAGQEENPVAEAVEALDEANAVLLDENGEPLNMASQEAEEVLNLPDPMFCPAGVAYGGPGCGPSQTTLADALNDWATAGHVSGTIYIEGGSFAGVTISGVNAATTDLVFQGGVGGGVTTITSLFSVTNSSFSSFTFNDISFDASFSADTNTGDLNFNDVNTTNPVEIGLYINAQDGNIQLNNVTANNSSYGILANSVSGNISLTNVTTNGNVNDGLNIEADGNITASNVTASNNGSDGFEIDEAAAVTLNNVTADGNATDGVDIDRITGNVTLNQVVANGNGDYGLEIDNVSGNLIITNVTVNGNDTDGMWIDRISGNVSLSHVTANGNDADGIDMQNIAGTITLHDVTAAGNGDNGIEISNLTGPQNVVITCSMVTNNGNYGFSIDANSGDLYLNSVTTGGNTNGNHTQNVTNTFIKQVDCNPYTGYPRDGKKVELDPNQPTTIDLELYAHAITFPPMDLAQCTGSARSLFFPSELPGGLPEGDSFLRALALQLEGCPIPDGAAFTISFAIPTTEQTNNFAVLFWNGSDWVEVPGALNAEGRYEVNWPQTGVFVLVTK